MRLYSYFNLRYVIGRWNIYLSENDPRLLDVDTVLLFYKSQRLCKIRRLTIVCEDLHFYKLLLGSLSCFESAYFNFTKPVPPHFGHGGIVSLESSSLTS